MGKFWEVLEIEQRLKSIVRAGLSSLDRVLHRYLPTAYWSYDLDQGFVQYNQSLSAIQWVDFTTQPRWRTAAEEVHDVSQLTNFYYQALDTIESLKPVFNLNIRTILPPFGSYALMAGDYHYFTYDKKYFRFAGECSYLLVGDLSTAADAFSLLVNYENRNGVIRKGSYSITANSSLVDIDVTDFKVSINGRKIELPLQLGTLFIRRHQTGLEVYDSRGFTMTCSLSYSVCTVGVSGWHFGKVAGILGTYDNEPSNDFQSPDGSQIRDVSAFAYSWRVGGNSGSCRMKNYAKDETELVDSDGICGDLLQKRSSPLRPCFNTVDTQVFLEMCVYDVSKNVNSAHRAEAACFAMNAYVTECQKNKVDVWMPPNCGKTTSITSLLGGNLNNSNILQYVVASKTAPHLPPEKTRPFKVTGSDHHHPPRIMLSYFKNPPAFPPPSFRKLSNGWMPLWLGKVCSITSTPWWAMVETLLMSNLTSKPSQEMFGLITHSSEGFLMTQPQKKGVDQESIYMMPSSTPRRWDFGLELLKTLLQSRVEKRIVVIRFAIRMC